MESKGLKSFEKWQALCRQITINNMNPLTIYYSGILILLTLTALMIFCLTSLRIKPNE